MRRFFLSWLILIFIPLAHAAESVRVHGAWVRLPPPGAEIGVTYLTLEAKQGMTLISAQSPAAESVELHSMTMHNGVMRMRHLPTLALAAGKPVKLEPGGLHLMLINLKKPLQVGDTVQLDLNFSQGKRAPHTVRVQALVKAPKD